MDPVLTRFYGKQQTDELDTKEHCQPYLLAQLARGRTPHTALHGVKAQGLTPQLQNLPRSFPEPRIAQLEDPVIMVADMPNDSSTSNPSSNTPDTDMAEASVPKSRGRRPRAGSADRGMGQGPRTKDRQKEKLAQLESELKQKQEEYQSLLEENGTLKQKLKVLESVVPLRTESAAYLSKAHSIGAGLSSTAMIKNGNFETCLCLLQQDLQPASLDNPQIIEKLKSVTAAEYQQLWKAFLKEASLLLVAAETQGPDSLANQELTQLVNSALRLFRQIGLLSPPSREGAMYVNLITGQEEKPPDSFWLGVAKMIFPSYSETQLKEFKAGHDHFYGSVAPIVEERKALGQHLQMQMSAVAVGRTMRPNLTLQIDELTRKMEKNMLKEASAQSILGLYLGMNMTAQQIAKLCAACYPYFPDTVAINSHTVRMYEELLEARRRVEFMS